MQITTRLNHFVTSQLECIVIFVESTGEEVSSQSIRRDEVPRRSARSQRAPQNAAMTTQAPFSSPCPRVPRRFSVLTLHVDFGDVVVVRR